MPTPSVLIPGILRQQSGILLSVLILVGLLSGNARAESTQILTPEIDLDCSQTDTMLACSWRLLGDDDEATITAAAGTTPLVVSIRKRYPASDSVTAVLFLIDTSDPGRQDVIDENAVQIERMLAAIPPQHRIGLASFDHDLVVAVPVGGDKNSIISAAHGLRASGMTTELYRSTLRAVELLGHVNADRKVIYLMSDGQAEDRAYFNDDVIRAAQKNGVIINSLGYPRSIPLSVALQTLRRLSEETGGLYLQTGMDFKLPESFLQAPLANIDRGGQFTIDLGPLQTSSINEITLQVKTSTSGFSVAVPVTLKRPTPVAAPVLAPLIQPAAAAAATPSTAIVPAEKNLMDSLAWYGLPVVLIIISLMMLVALILMYRRQAGQVPASVVPIAERKPAWLIRQDGSNKRFPITTATCRIGRSRENEMTLADNSVSRRHAEIRRTFDGQYVLYDRDSTNGVYVNDQKIRQHYLSEGDVIEIGDVFIIFTQKQTATPAARKVAADITLAP